MPKKSKTDDTVTDETGKNKTEETSVKPKLTKTRTKKEEPKKEEPKKEEPKKEEPKKEDITEIKPKKSKKKVEEPVPIVESIPEKPIVESSINKVNKDKLDDLILKWKDICNKINSKKEELSTLEEENSKMIHEIYNIINSDNSSKPNTIFDFNSSSNKTNNITISKVSTSKIIDSSDSDTSDSDSNIKPKKVVAKKKVIKKEESSDESEDSD
jgi:hypothetical protein